MTEENKLEKLPLSDPDASPIEERKLGLKDRIKMIKFGEEFEKWPMRKQVDFCKKLASAMNQAADQLQNERNAILEEVAVCRKQVENADAAVAIQKNTLITQITSHNKENQEYIKLVQELERENKSLTTELNDYKLQE